MRISKLVIVLGLAAVACSSTGRVERTDRTETVSGAQIIDPENGPYCAGGATPTTLVPRWRFEYVGSFDPSSILDMFVENFEDIGVAARVAVRSFGLDGRRATRVLWEGTIAAHDQRHFDMAIVDLPIRSFGVESLADIEVTILEGERAGEMVSSRPLHVRFEPDLSRAELYGEHPPDERVLASPATFEDALVELAPYVDAVHDVRGEILLAGRYASVGSLTPNGDEYFEQKQLRTLSTHDSHLVHNLFHAYSPTVDTGFDSVRICATWRAEFVDEGKGEEIVGPPHPASFAQAWLVRADAGRDSGILVWSGHLDREGCSGSLRMQDYAGYAFSVATHLSDGTRDVTVHENGALRVDVTGFSTLQVLRATGNPIRIRLNSPSVGSHYSRVSAVASTALAATQGIWPRVSIPAGAYRLESDGRCLGAPEYSACYRHGADDSERAVYVGPIEAGSHNSQWKFVIAHEIGHAVHDYATRVFPSYVIDDAEKFPVCGCSHIPLEDRTHCLQSQERVGFAVNEGFAHYFASNLYNTTAGADCTFVYHKSFLEPSGNILPPPVARSCSAKVRWLEKHCPAPARGVEWDWLNFDRAIAVATNPTRMGDLFSIWNLACGGPCNTAERNFAEMSAAADQYYGSPQDPRAFTFQERGVSYGVDH
jgi:hypothetical protein